MAPNAAPRRVLFMGTPDFAVPSLRALYARGKDYGGQVVAVATQPDRPAGRKRTPVASPVKATALELGLPVLQPERLRKNPEAVQVLADLAPDLIVVAAYGLILPKAVLEIPRHGCVNVHASLLPAYRGASPIAAVLLDGLSATGVSIMLMDEGMDTGPVLAQAATPIQPDDTTASLTARLAQNGAGLLIPTLARYLAGDITPVPQADLPGAPSVCGRIQKEDGRIDWSQSAAHIERMTRAYFPWPGAYTTWQGQPFKIVQAEAINGHPAQVSAGTVVSLGDGARHGVAVRTGQGLLRLRQVQPAGKRTMDVASFLNGASDFIGATLGA